MQQPGIGELRLVAPALRQLADRKIVLIAPPHEPSIIAFAGLGLTPENLIWIRSAKSKKSADLFWAAEQVLRSGSCGALLVWSNHTRGETLRRLNLTAQGGQTLFFTSGPLATAQDASPSPLRLALRPASGGIEFTFIKRRGPQRDTPLLIPLPGHHVVPVELPRVRERVKVAVSELSAVQ